MHHTQSQTLARNQRHDNSRTYPELIVSSSVTEQELTYYAALELVARIDEDLTRGTRHYRNKAGVLLTALDEVIRAILGDDLLLPEEQQEAAVVWLTPQELVA